MTPNLDEPKRTDTDINAVDFHLDSGAVIQVCKDDLLIWCDGDVSDDADLQISITDVERMIAGAQWTVRDGE